MSDLIKRIDAALYDDADPYQALRDRRAEIASLHDAAQQQAVVIEQPSIDALIADIDDLSPSHVNDEYGCKHSDTLIMYHACDIKAIIDKYRSKK